MPRREEDRVGVGANALNGVEQVLVLVDGERDRLLPLHARDAAAGEGVPLVVLDPAAVLCVPEDRARQREVVVDGPRRDILAQTGVHPVPHLRFPVAADVEQGSECGAGRAAKDQRFEPVALAERQRAVLRIRTVTGR